VYRTGWLHLWNLLDVATYGLQACVSGAHVMRFGLNSNWQVPPRAPT
jgi:hypothetical protein